MKASRDQKRRSKVRRRERRENAGLVADKNALIVRLARECKVLKGRWEHSTEMQDAAWEAGAERMRELAAAEARSGGLPETIAERIEALPLKPAEESGDGTAEP